jgi:MoxR-like ATPase
MPKCKLFESWSFRLSRPTPFDDPEFDGAKDFGLSRYNAAGSLRKATLHAATLRAMMAYAKLRIATDHGEDLTDLGAIGHQGSTYHIAEYHSAGKTDCVVFNLNTGKFTVSQFADGTDIPKPMTLGAGNSSGTALLFCLMPKFEEDDEFRDNFEDFKTQMESGWPDSDAALRIGLILCDNVYRRVENARNVGAAAVKVSITATGNLAPIAQMAMDNGTYSPSGVLYGTFTRLQPGTSATSGVPIVTNEDFAGKYSLSNRTLTQREQAMVPHLADWYIVPREVVRVCEHAKATTSAAQPMRNFLFRGNAGTGKTMGAQAIAAGLNLPYTLMTCSANTEITDLVGQFIPDTREAAASGPDDLGLLPKISDIIMHPPSVYKELTGEYDEEKTEDDVLQKLIEIAVGRLACREETQGQRIRYVDTPLLDAIRHGYVCELQEPSCIANPGVLVGLNSLLDNCQTITLPTGERVQRHPDAVIIVTTNSDYEGCRSINQSVISRMDLIYDMESPDINTMVQRVQKITGFNDEAMAAKMALVVRDIADRCRQTMITDGSCGMREFKSWVLSTMVTNDPYESALTTVIASASADADNRAELISTCLDPQFTQKI